jgi:hypothetical protein
MRFWDEGLADSFSLSSLWVTAFSVREMSIPRFLGSSAGGKRSWFFAE